MQSLNGSFSLGSGDTSKLLSDRRRDQVDTWPRQVLCNFIDGLYSEIENSPEFSVLIFFLLFCTRNHKR